MKVNKLIVSSFAFVAIFVVSSNAHSRAAPCTKCKADCVNMQEFDKYACECYCPYGRRGPSWGCDSNKFWDRTNCDCACNATQPAGGCGLGEWNKERCACYCPRPESPTPSGKTWARHPTCAYVCRNPKPANLPAFKQWNEDKCRVECIPTKPDPIPAGKRWCEDCCQLSCIAKPPCSLAIPANKQWSTESCSVECINPKPAAADIPSNKQWNDITCALECKDPITSGFLPNQRWNSETCALECIEIYPDVTGRRREQIIKRFNPNTCALECVDPPLPSDIPANKHWDENICLAVCNDQPSSADLLPNQSYDFNTCTRTCITIYPDEVNRRTGQVIKSFNPNTCALECVNPPLPSDIPANKHWDENICLAVCNDQPSSADLLPNQSYDYNTCTRTCITIYPDEVDRRTGQVIKSFNPNTCALECIASSSSCVFQQTWLPDFCQCYCKYMLCDGLKSFSTKYCGCYASMLHSGECLTTGQRLVRGCFYFVFEASGSAVLYNGDNIPLWSTNSLGGEKICMGTDGNLVVTADNNIIWQSGTSGTDAVQLMLQFDGNLQLGDGRGNTFWESNTTQNVLKFC